MKAYQLLLPLVAFFFPSSVKNALRSLWFFHGFSLPLVIFLHEP